MKWVGGSLHASLELVTLLTSVLPWSVRWLGHYDFPLSWLISIASLKLNDEKEMFAIVFIIKISFKYAWVPKAPFFPPKHSRVQISSLLHGVWRSKFFYKFSNNSFCFHVLRLVSFLHVYFMLPVSEIVGGSIRHVVLLIHFPYCWHHFTFFGDCSVC